MASCLKTQLKASVNNDSLEFFNSKRLKYGVGVFSFRPVAGTKIDFLVEAGEVLQSSDHSIVVGGVGDTITIPVGSGENEFYIGQLPSQIRVLDNNTVNYLGFTFLQERTKVSDFAVFVNVSTIRCRAEVSSTNFVGSIEEYVEHSVLGGKTNQVEINGNYLTFNNTSETSQVYRITYDTDTVSVYRRGDVTTTEALVGTYNKTTKVWSYV